MTLFINPGSGPVEGATYDHAFSNLEVFCRDLIAQDKVIGEIRDPGNPPDDGRYYFEVEVDGVYHEIEMPGIPIDQVRWMGEPEQNIWDFPRLYIDGSSWIWKFALDVTRVPDPEDE